MCITINVSSNNCNVVKKNIKDHKIADQMLCVCYNLSGAFLLECQTSARKYVIVKVVGTLKTYIFNILYMDVFIANKSDILKKMCFFHCYKYKGAFMACQDACQKIATFLRLSRIIYSGLYLMTYIH